MGAYGLQTHIWNNNLKSIALLASFPLLLLLPIYAFNLIAVGLTTDIVDVREGLIVALQQMRGNWPFAFLGAGVWFVIAWFAHQPLINAATGAKPVTRAEAPDLYNLLENLCISRGITAPKLGIIETPALNAFASGVDEGNYSITLTRGLVEALDKRELEAVLAHELTHIRNRDVRLLVFAIIFVGIFSFVGELLFRGLFRSGIRVSGHSSGRKGDSRGGGILILIALALIVLAYLLAILIRFSLSQKREYLADAGAADLTRDPDAMISALQKISGRSRIDAPREVRLLMLEDEPGFFSMFATHPTIEKRIAALENYAGGAA